MPYRIRHPILIFNGIDFRTIGKHFTLLVKRICAWHTIYFNVDTQKQTKTLSGKSCQQSNTKIHSFNIVLQKRDTLI